MCCKKKQPINYFKSRIFKSSVYTDADSSAIIFPSNFVKTSKYTALDFIPKSLLA